VSLTLTAPDCLAPEGRSLLARLAGFPWAGDVYLAGSAALSLYLAHRPVQDLDLMSGSNRFTPTDRRDLLADLLAVEPATRVETARDGYLFVRAGAVALRFHYYPYPLAAPPSEIEGFPVASPLDLGLMKLGALISRGSKRDFVDLYLLAQQLPLAHLLAAAPGKFGHVLDFPLQALKALTDFSECDGEPLPRLSAPLRWDEVQAWALAEAKNGLAATLGEAP
jgi:Nucleotidyl transferase AbiEii toxin, Type IV TA system